MPAYYIPHPALHQIIPPVNASRQTYALQWDSDDTLKYVLHTEYVRETTCLKKQWGTHTPPDITQIFTETTCFTPTQEANSEAFPQPTGETDPVVIRRLSPDKEKIFELLQVSVLDTALLRLGTHTPESKTAIFEGWLGRVEEEIPSSLFYTVEDFSYFWTGDSQYLIAVGDVCYGGGNPPQSFAATGLFSIDAQTLSLHPIAPDYVAGCEGSLGYRISPTSHHILYEPGIVSSIDGKLQMRICPEGEYARSYTWSQHGRYAYVACGITGQSDVLHRYDVQTGNNQCLTHRDTIGFRAIEMAVSPNQTWLAFVWDTSPYMPREPYGIWRFDLNQLDEAQ